MDTWSFFSTCLVSLWLHRLYVYSAVAFGISVWIVIQFSTSKPQKKVTEHGENPTGNPASSEGIEEKLVNGCATLQRKEVYVAGVKIFYGSQTGMAKRFARALAEAVISLNVPVEVISMGDCDPDDCLLEETTSRNICVFLVATYTDGQPTESAAWFCRWLEEAANDFRFGKAYLKGLRYAVFGLGNSVYVDHYNTVGRNIDRWLWMLSASRVMTRAEGDCNVAQSKHDTIEADFEAWKAKFVSCLQALCRGEKKPCSGKCKKGKCKSPGKQGKESSDHEHGTSECENTEAEELFESSSEEEADAEEGGEAKSVVDVEDLGNIMRHMKEAKVGRNIDRWLWMLSASRVMTRAEGDCNVAQSKHDTIEADFEAWKAKFVSRLQALCRGEKKPCSGKCKKGKCKSPGKQGKESSDHEHGTSECENTEAEELFESSSEEEADAEEGGEAKSVVDVEDLGNIMRHMKEAKVGRNIDRWLWMLSASRVMTRAEGDCNVAQSKHGTIEADFEAWKAKFVSRLQALCRGEKKPCSGKCKKGKCKSPGKQGKESSDHEHGTSECENTEAEELFESSSEEEADAEEGGEAKSVVDVEDLGNIMRHMTEAKREHELEEGDVGMRLTQEKAGRKEEDGKREMITPAVREALTKQGYKLIGSHSGVKLCRWTKSMLRGRGGCYKHTFYGIESHRCMEATPSLACANKCVFCWRHHTNPVGTEWRWKMDQPEMILQEAIENHQNMIKQFKGVSGVQAARFEEAMTAKHCALSLVGEPIMYPEINRFVRLLHQHSISTFLVTNAQFPDEIRNLEPVTQLYVSVDASTKESLKRIDRPLFKDFWQRFLDSLKALSEKQQRTVYRLTLVKAWNVDELKAYADLISLGKPDFIEVKGVTYCGKSSASNLTMANVPWHEEVVHFVQELTNLIPDYEIACEHEHSNCLLIAHKKFKIDGEWCTWIDYDRFQELVRAQEQSSGSQTFTAADYTARTPHWALFGSRERGFDPLDVRYQRKNKARDISGC
ncbi:S-adenosyl-L-methionine-dependent tRNA 4-demethylwyosine synthase TYW1-like isoform 5-T7 [Amazona ochrocephala]